MASELGPARVARVDALDVQVLRVGHRGGETPRNVAVVTDENARRARQAGPGHVQLTACRQMRLVEDRGKAREHVRIVGQQRLAGARAGTRDGPGIAGTGPTGERDGW